jgi:hypothetical protein
MTALLAAENILAGRRVYEVWNVNQDAEYHESGTAGAEQRSAGPDSRHEMPMPAQPDGEPFHVFPKEAALRRQPSEKN